MLTDEERQKLQKARDELKKDFVGALEHIDFDAYDSSSFEFRAAERKACMWACIDRMLCEEEGAAPDGNAGDIDEELKGAEKYADLYRLTGRSIYREMAGDELKHAGYLIDEYKQTGAGGDKAQQYTERHDAIARKV